MKKDLKYVTHFQLPQQQYTLKPKIIYLQLYLTYDA